MESAETFGSPGKYLRAVRESQGVSLNEMAKETKIREPVLMALEEDRYANLPSIYVKSFLSTYAQYLGLDPSEVIIIHQKYAEKLPFSKDQELKHPPTIRSNRANVRMWVISILAAPLMALIGYALFMLLR